MAKVTHHGLAKKGDPIYSTETVIGGARWINSRKGAPPKDSVVSRDVMDLKRVVKIVSAEMHAALFGKAEDSEHEA
jgi:hypothetical protein